MHGFPGFTNPVDPTADELRAWAYHPDAVPLEDMPPDWDLLLATDDLAGVLFELAMDRACPARRFALHCLYIYTADGVRQHQHSTGRRRRRLRAFIERADQNGDGTMQTWAHNSRVLMGRPNLLDQKDWFEGGLVRNPRRIGLFPGRDV